MGITNTLAKFVAEKPIDLNTVDLLKASTHAIIDCLGVALAGTASPPSRLITEYAKGRGGNREARIIGSGLHTSAPLAALVMGTMAHALDYDDYSFVSYIHPSVCVLPAVLALGQQLNSSGREILEAFIVGFEVETRLGMALAGEHYEHGWHSTGTAGTMGATAAACRIIGLNMGSVTMAFGIAASMAGGLRQNFGTMTKPLHAGNAASNGVTAALLARDGFTSDIAILEAPIGFHHTFNGNPEKLITAEKLCNPYAIIRPGAAIKPYPSCGSTHRCIDAAIFVHNQAKPYAKRLQSVECHVEPLTAKVLFHHKPKTGLEGKFSLEYCVAIALLQGRVGLDHFIDSAVKDEAAQDAIHKVSIIADCGTNERPSLGHSVSARFSDGSVYTHEVTVPKGDPYNPMSYEEIAAKFRDCVAAVAGVAQVDHSLDLLRHLETVKDINQVVNIFNNNR